jgi:TonB-linked SusC/RagA family outer membrane protein
MKVFCQSKLWLLLCTGWLLFFPAAAQQPAIPVSGSVKNEKGEPLPAVSVKVAGTERGTLTDANGIFNITVPEHTRLVISFVGYDTVAVAAKPGLDIILRLSANTLNDVVVIGYGTQRRRELTGSVATINSKDFQTGVITTPEQLIAGKVAGVSVTSSSGAPGAGSVIRIRGIASLNASNDPLIVIDGLPLSGNNIYGASNSLSLINPNDIASFTILKDAAATAIYGSRASNGVILITTRRGSGGTPVYNFSTQVSLSRIARKMKVQSADDFRRYVDSLGGGTYDNVHTYKSLMGNASTDWQDEIFQSAVSTDNNFSITGSFRDLPYRVSVGYMNQQGILRTDHLQRFSGGISLSPRLLKDHLKVDINLKGAYNKARFANNAAISSAVYFDPTQPVKTSSPYLGYFEWASVDAGSGAVTLNKLAPRNPVALLDLYNNSSNVYRSYGNMQLDYKMHWLPELHVHLNLGYDIAKGDGTTDVPAEAAQNFLEGGQRNQYANRINNKVGELYLNYTKDLAGISSHLNVIAGYGYYNNLSTNYSYPFIRANGDTIPGSKPLFAQDKPENTLISYYGRMIYTFHNKYILAASIRTDGSSRFAKDVRWGTFPSVAFTWQLIKEDFLKEIKPLSDLKLRLSYGVTGNQDGIYNYPYQSIYSLSGNGSAVQFGNEWYYMGTPAAYDAGIKWEQTATWNAGIDYGFLNNRINGSIDFYFKKTKDLLNTIPIPAGSNFSSTILTNVGNVENKGVELAINANLIRNSRLSWDIGFNAAYNENEITNLTATKDSTYPGTLTGNGFIQINSVGYEANAFYVYHQQYFNGKPVEGVYADVNKDGMINQKDLYRYKSPFPKFLLGFSTQLSYGKWTLNTVLRSNIGNYMYNGIATGAVRANILNPLGYLANSLDDVRNTGFINGQNQSDYYIENASFLKMDNLGLSYNAGKLFRDKLSLRLTANCQNVFTITKYRGLDPEIYGGIDNAIYPRPRIFVLGASIQFQ